MPEQFLSFLVSPNAAFRDELIHDCVIFEIAYQRALLLLYYVGKDRELSRMNIGLVLLSSEVSL